MKCKYTPINLFYREESVAKSNIQGSPDLRGGKIKSLNTLKRFLLCYFYEKFGDKFCMKV